MRAAGASRSIRDSPNNYEAVRRGVAQTGTGSGRTGPPVLALAFAGQPVDAPGRGLLFHRSNCCSSDPSMSFTSGSVALLLVHCRGPGLFGTNL